MKSMKLTLAFLSLLGAASAAYAQGENMAVMDASASEAPGIDPAIGGPTPEAQAPATQPTDVMNSPQPLPEVPADPTLIQNSGDQGIRADQDAASQDQKQDHKKKRSKRKKKLHGHKKHHRGHRSSHTGRFPEEQWKKQNELQGLPSTIECPSPSTTPTCTPPSCPPASCP